MDQSHRCLEPSGTIDFTGHALTPAGKTRSHRLVHAYTVSTKPTFGIVDIDQSRVCDDLDHEWPGCISYVAALGVWASYHRNGAAVAGDVMRVSVSCARARSARRPVRKARPGATEARWQ